MRGASAWSLTLSGVLLRVPAPAAFGQAAAIPLSLGVAASPAEIDAGYTVKTCYFARAWLPQPGAA